jgi:SNF2 family DNA or RNA helicase
MNARLFRQGQKAETVVIVHIVTKGTVDSRVLKALAEKDRIQEALIDAVKAEVTTWKDTGSWQTPLSCRQ